MAITRTQKDSLTDVQVGREKVSKIEGDAGTGSTKTRSKAEKKPGFLATTFDELRKVEWPTRRYTFNWSVVIILFTVFISLFMGLVDHTFTSGVRFATCTSTLNAENRESGVRDCANSFGEDILFRNGIQ